MAQISSGPLDEQRRLVINYITKKEEIVPAIVSFIIAKDGGVHCLFWPTKKYANIYTFLDSWCFN